jgi:hypothetical protein
MISNVSGFNTEPISLLRESITGFSIHSTG